MRALGIGQNGVYGQPDMGALHRLMVGNHPAMPQFHTGGNLPAQGFMPQTGGQLPAQQFQPMTGGSSYPMLGGQMQPQGLAAMFRGYSPYRYG